MSVTTQLVVQIRYLCNSLAFSFGGTVGRDYVVPKPSNLVTSCNVMEPVRKDGCFPPDKIEIMMLRFQADPQHLHLPLTGTDEHH